MKHWAAMRAAQIAANNFIFHGETLLVTCDADGALQSPTNCGNSSFGSSLIYFYATVIEWDNALARRDAYNLQFNFTFQLAHQDLFWSLASR